MTKKWSSTASLDGQTKRAASKATRRQPKITDCDHGIPLDMPCERCAELEPDDIYNGDNQF